MAKATPKQETAAELADQTTGELTTQQAGALATQSEGFSFEDDAGQGHEGVDKDSQAIPFMTILQGLSPQMETVEGAKLGHIINTVTNEVRDAIHVIPVAFQRRYNAWAPRKEGGGFKGTFAVDEVEIMIADGKAEYVEVEGRTKLMHGKNELKDTRNHFVLVVRDDGSYYPALISMSSTQIKRSKRWIAIQKGIQMKRANGSLFTPPSFSHAYRLGPSEKESNNDGTWYSWTTHKIGPVQDKFLYDAAKDFHAQVMAGTVKVQDPIDMGGADESGAGEREGF